MDIYASIGWNIKYSNIVNDLQYICRIVWSL